MAFAANALDENAVKKVLEQAREHVKPVARGRAKKTK